MIGRIRCVPDPSSLVDYGERYSFWIVIYRSNALTPVQRRIQLAELKLTE